MSSLPGWVETALRLVVAAGVLGSLVAVLYVDRDRGWGDRLRSRLLLGIPWGSLVVTVAVLSVYLFVQGGFRHWFHPVKVAYISWSYLYPLGTLVAPFAHAGPGHLVGNLLGTVVLAPLAEYVWGHYPRARGSETFASPRTNPYVRAFVLFPAAVFAVGLLTGLLGWGPAIGFSGVVFAFGGFALVRYPVVTVVALSARRVVGTVYSALADPVITGSAGTSFGKPWWAGIHVQAHALGLLLGVFLGVALLWQREERPSALGLWAGTLIYAVSLSLWAIWWYRGGDSYVLYRGPGVAVVVVLAVVVVGGVLATDRPLVGTLTRRQAAALLFALPLVTMAMVAVPVNLTTVAAGSDGPAATVEVRGYDVFYAEQVPDRMVSIVDVTAFGETTQVNTSGVVVVNTDRHLWWRAVSRSKLAANGRSAFALGGLGWRRTVIANRSGWAVAGGGTAYRVHLRAGGAPRRLAYTSPPATAAPVVAGRNVSVVPVAAGFNVSVSRNGTTLSTVRMPAPNGSVAAAGLRLVREEGRLLAEHDDTRVTVAVRETYRD